MVNGSKGSSQSNRSKHSIETSLDTIGLQFEKTIQKPIDYKEELILYLYNETLPYVVDRWQKHYDADVSEASSLTSKNDLKYLTESVYVHPRSIGTSTAISTGGETVNTVRSSRFERRNSSATKRSALPSLPAIEELSYDTSTAFIQNKSKSETSFNWIVESKEESVRILFKNGNEYVGMTKKKRMHGKGLFRWADGTVYKGEFYNGEITGQGTLTYSDLSYYYGHFYKGKLHGVGSFYPLLTTLIYNGNWCNGKKHGKGWLLYGPNNYYDGEWYQDKKQGIGFRNYEAGDTYYGSWKNGMPDGVGTMRFSNNDFYKGEWREGQPHGYGEYTWNCYLNKGIALPLENMYQGSWENGERHGYGIITFGMEGSKLASAFTHNKKDGVGILVCGDGTIIEKNPLFINDSPTDVETVEFVETPSVVSSTRSLLRTKSASKGKLKAASPSRDDALIEDPSVRTIANVFPEIKPKCSPINIPIHGNASQIDLNFHIQKLHNALQELIKPLREVIPTTWNTVINPRIPASSSIEFSEFAINFEFEERKLRNTILLNYGVIESVYKKYSALTCADNKAKTIMSRLFLWQLYKDLKIYKSGCSLIDTDLLLIEHPELALESEHCPFEKIYFWQFMHSIICVAFKCYASYTYFAEYKKKGILAEMLKHFIAEYILPNEGTFDGQFLFKYINLLPVPAACALYQSLGEAPTLQTFLKECCIKTVDPAPCYLRNKDFENPVKFDCGINCICSGINVMYIPNTSTEIGERPKDIIPYPIERDEFYTNLKLFRRLGPRGILNCATVVCPMVKHERFIVNIGYRLTFLEFFEIIILCAEALIKKEKEERERLRLYEESLSKSVPITKDEKGKKEKKSKK